MNKPIENSFVSVFDKHLCHLYTQGGDDGFSGVGVLKI